MLAELRDRSQITIPANIMKKLGAKKGDLFEVIERDGGIFLCPVVVYPKAETERIKQLIETAENEPDKAVFSDINSLFADMGINADGLPD